MAGSSDYKDNIEVVAFALDEMTDAVRNVVEEKKLTNIQHYHARNEQCTVDRDFNVQGIPTLVIVGKSDQILFCGHPGMRDFEADIKQIINDGQDAMLEGKGTVKNPLMNTDEPNCEQNKDKIVALKKQFIEESESYMRDHQQQFKEFRKAFLNWTCDEYFLSFDEKNRAYDIQCHPQLIGGKDKSFTID